MEQTVLEENPARARVCHFTSVHSHTDTRIFVKECQSLTDYDVHLIAPDAPEKEVRSNLLLHGLKQTERKRLTRMLMTSFEVFMRARSLNADIYHFHDPELLPYGVLLSWTGRKVIYDAHEDYPRTMLYRKYLPKWSRPLMVKLTELLEDFAAKRFSAIVSATPHINERFSKLNPYSVTVCNYPKLSEFPIEREFRVKESVCYVGVISETRGLTAVTKSLERCAVPLALAGKFAYPDYRQQLSELDGWQHVREMGFLSRNEVCKLMRNSLAGIVVLKPTINYVDSLPVKMFEYMASGIPVIASNFPLWRSIVETARCGVCVDWDDEEQISDAIAFMKNNQREAFEMGQRGRKAVEEIYNWEQESLKLNGLYEKVLT